MKKWIEKLLFLLAVFLPFHGAITVFFRDEFRFWKELVVIVLFGFFLVTEFRSWWKTRTFSFSWSEIFAFLFLIWSLILTVLSSDQATAFVAARYLSFGFFVFLILSRLLRHFSESEKKELFQKFAITFLISCAVAVLFGTWMKYLGGFSILHEWYSPTISSWVPGQRVPIYHQAGDFIRMQGGSSGPTEFAHLLLAAFFLLPFMPLSSKWKVGLATVFLFGIFQSFTRTVTLLAVVGLVFFFFHQQWKKLEKYWPTIVFMFLFLLGVAWWTPSLRENFLLRAGSSEHLTRPWTAIRFGLSHPISGNLGKIGPSARAKNLREYNDDRALIAENIFADYFAQLGLIGVGLAIAFFVSLFFAIPRKGWPFLIATLVAVNIATIFDMIPVSIVFLLLFAFFSAKGTILCEVKFLHR